MFRTICTILTAILLATGLSSAAHAQKVVVGTGVDPSFTPLYVALQLNMFKTRGLDVEMKVFSSGSAAVPALISGDINISMGAPAAALLNHMRARKITMVAQFSRQQGYAELIGKRSIANVPGLAGQRVGFELGTATEVFAMEVLAEHKTSPSVLRHVNLQPPEGLAALQRDDLDAVFTFKPWSDRMLAAMPDRLHKIPGTENFQTHQHVFMDREWAEKNPTQATAFLGVLREAIALANADKDQAARLVGQQLRMEAAAVRPLLDLNEFTMRFDDETVKLLRREVDLQQRTGRMGRDFSYREFVFTEPLRRLDASIVSYTLPQ